MLKRLLDPAGDYAALGPMKLADLAEKLMETRWLADCLRLTLR